MVWLYGFASRGFMNVNVTVVESVLKRKHTLAKRTVTMELAAKQVYYNYDLLPA